MEQVTLDGTACEQHYSMHLGNLNNVVAMRHRCGDESLLRNVSGRVS